MKAASAETLRKRATWRLTLAATIASAFLAPMILSTFWFALNSHNHGKGDIGSLDLRVAAILAMIPAACLGGLAMHRGATLRSSACALRWALGGGVLFLGASVLCAGVSTFLVGQSPDRWVVPFAICLPIVGSVVSAPMGIAFGILFLIGLEPLTRRLQRPAIDTPTSATLTSTLMLCVATGVAMLFAAANHVPVAHNHVALDAAWLARILLPALPMSTLAFAFVGLRETRALHRERSAILSGTHPEYLPGNIAPEEDATPLTERDRESGQKRLLVMRTPTAYRGGEARIPAVYVGVTQ